MISLSYESSAYEESQSQAKLTVALNEKNRLVPSILPKKRSHEYPSTSYKPRAKLC